MNTEQKKQLHSDFWQGGGPCLIFIPTAEMAQYDTANYEQLFYDPRKMREAEIKRAQPVLEWPTDGIPAVRPNLGTVFIPAIAGQEFIVKNGSMPWPGRHFSIEEMASIKKTDLNTAKLMRSAETFYEIHRAEGSKEICAYLADTQGVFDILHLLRGDELFYELADEKDLIKELLESITDLYIAVSRRLKKAAGEEADSMIHGHGTPQGLFFPGAGVRLSEDTPTLLSPAMIDEFVLPYMEKAAKPFGGAFVHFCGKHEYLYDRILERDFVKAVDLGNPEMFDTGRLLKKCAETNTVFYGKLAAAGNETWQEYIKRIAGITNDTGARCVLRPSIFPAGFDECKEMCDLWHQLTSG